MTSRIDSQGKSTRKRKPKTDVDYGRRYDQLKRAAARTAPKPLTVTSFIDWIIETKRPSWCPSSWRQNRAAVRFGLERECLANPALAPHVKEAINRLTQAHAAPCKDSTLRTSQQKAKRMPVNDYTRIRHAALASRSPNRYTFVDLLLASKVTGVRLVEWPSAQFMRSPQPGFAWELVVQNGKYDEVRDDRARAHGEFRTLRWVEMDEVIVSAIERWIAVATRSEIDGLYAKLLRVLRGLMHDLTRKLFPRREKRPTLGTGRHEAIARWKAHYVESQPTEEARLHGLAIIAALSGHASDETATVHYGRPRRGERDFPKAPIPVADAAEIARVRRQMQRRLGRLAELKSTHYGMQP